MDNRDEIKGFDNYSDLLDLLKSLEVSHDPAYSGFGLEVYENTALEIQVVVNLRGNFRDITVNRGF